MGGVAAGFSRIAKALATVPFVMDAETFVGSVTDAGQVRADGGTPFKQVVRVTVPVKLDAGTEA